MSVYKDVLELSRIHEIIDELDNYPVFKSGKLMEDEEGPYLWLDFYEEIPVYYEDEEFIKNGSLENSRRKEIRILSRCTKTNCRIVKREQHGTKTC